MIERFVVTPTRGFSTELATLNAAVGDGGATHIIIHPNDQAPVGLPTMKSMQQASRVEPKFHFEDAIDIIRDAQNFQRWGNLGFRKALEIGGDDTIVLMINDDIVITPHQLDKVFKQLENADVLTMDDRPAGGVTPMTGWLFGVRPSKILMDEEYVFWWGDDDLWKRAEEEGLRTVQANARYVHDRGKKRAWDTIFDPIMRSDKERYHARWG